jgi:hypothetical protein
VRGKARLETSWLHKEKEGSRRIVRLPGMIGEGDRRRSDLSCFLDTVKLGMNLARVAR